MAPSLAVRTDRRAPWSAHRVGGDLLGLAWKRVRLDAQIGVGRHHGARLELGWDRGELDGPLVGLGYELWPMGRGVDGLFFVVGGRLSVALEGPERADAFAEIGYRHLWRGATIGASLGAAHRWTLETNGTRRWLPVGSISVGWAF
ncbi:MAG: hypothetical protein JJ863_12500 [Deltaproteobacteria bacterium]|nr:hypothetical protein [Deltaproteobacteria bacterium]